MDGLQRPCSLLPPPAISASGSMMHAPHRLFDAQRSCHLIGCDGAAWVVSRCWWTTRPTRTISCGGVQAGGISEVAGTVALGVLFVPLLGDRVRATAAVGL